MPVSRSCSPSLHPNARHRSDLLGLATSRLFASIVVALLCQLPRVARAQSPQTLQAFQKGPYLCDGLEALVGVVVTNRAEDGSLQTRYGNGMLLRCDGFVLVPAEMFNTRNVAGQAPALPSQSVAIYLHPGTGQEQRVGGRRPNWYGFLDVGEKRYRFGYAVLKLDNFHAPAARTLLPDALRPGSPLRVVWSGWDETTHHFRPLEMRDMAVGERKPSDPKDKTPEIFRQQTTPFARPLEPVPQGALVLGAEHLAVGMVTARLKESASFENLASLHLATNCVSPLPSSDAAFMARSAPGYRINDVASPVAATVTGKSTPKPLQADTSQPGFRVKEADVNTIGDKTRDKTGDGNGDKAEDKGGVKPEKERPELATLPLKSPRIAVSAEDMVAVPGGPVTLPKVLQALQADMEASRVACVAPFLIDRNEVTNAQYLAFWKSLPASMRRSHEVQADLYPYSWGPEDKPFPRELEQVPVLSVRLPGARAYAKWVGKRLPTPYEWCLAAFGPTGGNEMPPWVKRFLQQRQEAWAKAVEAHKRYALAHPEVVPQFDVHIEQTLINNVLVPQMINYGENGQLFYAIDPSRDHPRLAEFFRIPWFFYFSRSATFQEEAEWSKATVTQLTDPLFTEWIDPIYVLPIGSRPFDVSPYGAMDMLLNARELVVPGPFFPWNRPPNSDWPVREIDRYIHIDFTLSDTDLVTTGRTTVDSGLGGPRIATSFPLDRLHDPNWIFQLLPQFPFLEHDGIFGDPVSVTVSGPQVPRVLKTDMDRKDWEMMFHNYTDEMRSHRFRTAYENEQLPAYQAQGKLVAPGESQYLAVRDALTEITELLRPVDQVEVSLKSGPTRDIRHTITGYDSRTSWQPVFGTVATRQPNGKVTRAQVVSSWSPILSIVPLPPLAQTSSFSLWNERPRHYHAEIGRTPDRVLERNRPALPGPNINEVPDTYAVPGGFRCVR